MSQSRLGLEAERLGSRLGLGHEGLVSIPDTNCNKTSSINPYQLYLVIVNIRHVMAMHTDCDIFPCLPSYLLNFHDGMTMTSCADVMFTVWAWFGDLNNKVKPTVYLLPI